MAFKDIRKRSLFRPWTNNCIDTESGSKRSDNLETACIPFNQSNTNCNSTEHIEETIPWSTGTEDPYHLAWKASQADHHRNHMNVFSVTSEFITPTGHHTVWCPEASNREGSGRWRVKKQRPKRFQCPHCHVSFSNNGQLKGHIRIHTGERPFACDHPECGKTFTRNEELTRHKRIHSGIRPFPCPLCGKRFGRKDHLKKHVKTHQRAHVLHFPPFQGIPYVLGTECLPWLPPM